MSDGTDDRPTPPPLPLPVEDPATGAARARTRMIIRIAVVVILIGLLGCCVASVAAIGPLLEAPSIAGLVAEDPVPEDPYEAAVHSALTVMWDDPENPDAITQVGHAYYDWAAALHGEGQSEEAERKWRLAISYYKQVLPMRPDDDVVLGNTAFALYYINSPDAVAALEKFIAAAEDNAELAEQVGIAQEYLSELQ